MLALSSVKLQVSYINYENHEIGLKDPENCLPHKFLQINDSLIHPYKFDDEAKTSKLSFFNCSSVEHQHLRNYQQSLSDSQDMISCPIYVSDLDDNTSSAEDFHVLYPDWMHDLVHGDVHIHVEDEGDVKIARKLAIVGLWCIQWQPLNRPSIKSVIQMLESKEEDLLTVPPNPFHSSTSTIPSGFTSARLPLELEVIQE
ncbi:hypothetical protein JHK85_048930 [Glycine max]|nr:hypothetical protein JHK85_048930 [Glycine max]